MIVFHNILQLRLNKNEILIGWFAWIHFFKSSFECRNNIERNMRDTEWHWNWYFDWRE